MKFTNIIIIVLLIVAVFLGISYIRQGVSDIDEPTTSNLGSPTETVNIYLYATLGSLPDAVYNTNIAAEHLADDLATQIIDNPSFVPLSYGIQDGPSSVKITDETISGKTATVTVEGSYGGTPSKEWTFTLKHNGTKWLITSIDNAKI